MVSPVRICIASPVYGSPNTGTVHNAYCESLMRVMTLGAAVVPTRIVSNCDLVRARSRAAQFAMDHCFTHLLFWDSDVAGVQRDDCALALVHMLREDRDIIAAAYPRKTIPARATHLPPYVPMGFSLIKVTALEKMWDAYYDELHFDDILDNKPIRSVALFALLFDARSGPYPHRVMLGEDYSFCERWLRLGGSVHLYDGPGAPLAHVGGWMFQGTREEIMPEVEGA